MVHAAQTKFGVVSGTSGELVDAAAELLASMVPAPQVAAPVRTEQDARIQALLATVLLPMDELLLLPVQTDHAGPGPTTAVA